MFLTRLAVSYQILDEADLRAAVDLAVARDIPVVVDDAGVTDSFRRSAGLVRENFAKTLGYNVIALTVSLVSAIPIVYYIVTQVSVSDASATAATNGFLGTSPSGGLVFFIATGVLSLLLGAFLRTYYVAYYTDRTEGRTETTA